MAIERRNPVGRGSERFWDRIAERYAKKPIADEAAYRQKLAITQLHLRPDMELLEFGCGTGSTALAHAPFVKHILATDISAKMIEIGRRKAHYGKVGNVTFEKADIDELTAAEGRFDAALGHSILHLVADRDAVIARVYRMLKPGGVFVSTTACLGDFLPVFKLVRPVGRALGLLPLLRVFTRTELRASLDRAGFVIEHEWQPGPRQGLFVVARRPR